MNKPSVVISTWLEQFMCQAVQRGCDASSHRGGRDALVVQSKSHRLVRARHARRWAITSTLLRRGRRSYLQLGRVLQ